MSNTETTQNGDQEESTRDTGVTSSSELIWFELCTQFGTRARKEEDRWLLGYWLSYPIPARRPAT